MNRSAMRRIEALEKLLRPDVLRITVRMGKPTMHGAGVVVHSVLPDGSRVRLGKEDRSDVAV